MLITFKTLQQKTFKIEIEETETIKVLKEKIAEERGNEFPVEGQKLIYAGKILDDEKKVSEYNIDPVKNFVVVMAVKPKTKPAEKPKDTAASSSTDSSASSSTPTPVSSTTESTPATSSTIITSDTTSTTSTPTPAQQPSTTSTVSADNMLLLGDQLETSVTELMQLGFPRDQVLRALQSSFNNADRAAEYLLSGNIPNINVAEPEAEPPETSETPAAGGEGNMPSMNDMNFLRNLPQFQAMRRQLQEHPEMLPQLLQEIGRENPQLLTLISQNQEQFISLLNEPSSQGVGGNAGGGGGGGGPVQPAPGGGIQIQVTPDEKKVIDNIIGMGFAEADVIQAYFACDKNEALTLEFLLNQQD